MTSKNLVAQLREEAARKADVFCKRSLTQQLPNLLEAEAANAIEDQAAEIERLERELRDARDYPAVCGCEYDDEGDLENMCLTHWRFVHVAIAEGRAPPLPTPETTALTECPYCKRPADSEGGIHHEGGCAGLETVSMNRLQYDRLTARPSHEAGAVQIKTGDYPCAAAFDEWRVKQPGHPNAFYDERRMAFQAGWYASRSVEAAPALTCDICQTQLSALPDASTFCQLCVLKEVRRLRGDLKTTADVLQDFDGEHVWQQAQAAVAEIGRLRGVEPRVGNGHDVAHLYPTEEQERCGHAVVVNGFCATCSLRIEMPSETPAAEPPTAQNACGACEGNGFYGTPGMTCNFCDGTGKALGRNAPTPAAEPIPTPLPGATHCGACGSRLGSEPPRRKLGFGKPRDTSDVAFDLGVLPTETPPARTCPGDGCPGCRFCMAPCDAPQENSNAT